MIVSLAEQISIKIGDKQFGEYAVVWIGYKDGMPFVFRLTSLRPNDVHSDDYAEINIRKSAHLNLDEEFENFAQWICDTDYSDIGYDSKYRLTGKDLYRIYRDSLKEQK